MNSLFNFFYFNKAERRALFVFLIAIVLIKVLSGYLKHNSPIETYNFEEYRQWWKDSVAPVLEHDESPIRERPIRSLAKNKEVINKKPLLLNLNEVDSIDLMSLPGIGEVYSSRIVRYRDLLGGYRSKEQLLEVYNLDSSLFSSIEPFIIVDSALVDKLHLNSANAETLAAHPYISYKLARIIIRYRNHHGSYNDISDLKKIPLIDEQLFRKIAFYLDLE